MSSNTSNHILQVRDRYYLSFVKDGEVYSDPVFPYLTKYLISAGLSLSTVKSYMTSIKRYFIYCLYNDNKENLALKDYVAQYKLALEKGFVVYDRAACSGFVINKKVFESPKLEESTIVKEWAALTAYYEYISDEKNQDEFEIIGETPIDIFYDKLDENYIRAKQRLASARTGVKFKIDSDTRKATKKRVTIFKDLIKRLSSRVRTQDRSYVPFPYKYFDSLIKVASLKDRALFLIQGLTSARVSQALSVTNHDIWFPCEENNYKGILWICRAQHNERPLYSLSKTKSRGHGITVYGNQIGRKELLLGEYGIDSTAYPWNNNQGKYPIPVHRRDTSLTILPSRKYRKLLFQTLRELIKNNFPVNIVGHPFIFQTKNGTIDRRQYVAKRFHGYIKKLERIHPEYDWSLLEGTHSLRHMFGQINADMFIKIKSNMKNATSSEIRELERQHKHNTARSMGHSNYNTVNIYYRATEEVEDAFIEELVAKYEIDIDGITKGMLDNSFLEDECVNDELPF